MPATRKNGMRKSMKKQQQKKQQQKRQQQKRQQQKKQQRKSMKKGGARRRRTQRKVMKGGEDLTVDKGDYVQNTQSTSLEVYVVDKVNPTTYDIIEVVVEDGIVKLDEDKNPILKKDAPLINISKEQEDLKYKKYAQPQKEPEANELSSQTPGAAAAPNAGTAEDGASSPEGKYVKVTYNKGLNTYTAETGTCTKFEKQSAV